MKFVMICGCPRSGTTMLTRILDAHPQVCALVDNPVLMIGKAGARINGGGLQAQAGRLTDSPIFGKCDRKRFFANMAFPATAEGLRSAIEISLPPGITCFAAKHTEYTFKLPRAAVGVDLVVYLYRDPRDVIESQVRGWADVQAGRRPPGPQWRKSIERAINAGSSWMDYMWAWDEAKRRPAIPFVEINYSTVSEQGQQLADAMGIRVADLQDLIWHGYRYKSEWRQKIPEVDAALPGTWRAMMERYGIA